MLIHDSTSLSIAKGHFDVKIGVFHKMMAFLNEDGFHGNHERSILKVFILKILPIDIGEKSEGIRERCFVVLELMKKVLKRG